MRKWNYNKGERPSQRGKKRTVGTGHTEVSLVKDQLLPLSPGRVPSLSSRTVFTNGAKKHSRVLQAEQSAEMESRDRSVWRFDRKRGGKG